MENLRVLIIGAGVAGLTCANLLSQHGINPQIVERESEDSFNGSGYMLGLLLLGGRVFNEMGLRAQYFNESIEMEHYNVHAASGELIQTYPLDFINSQYGSYRGISRVKLIEVLLEQVSPEQILFDTIVQDFSQKDEKVSVQFSNGENEIFDLVIVADGLHSQTRKLLLTEGQYQYRETGWGGWVTWVDAEPTTAYDEFWGAGSFLGLYPVKDHIGVFLGGSVDAIKEKGRIAFINEVAQEVSGEYALPHKALQSLQETSEPYFWKFRDCRSDIWHQGTIVLLGDAAAGFLPTAGVGASMAMDSASALVDELSRADRHHLSYALQLFTQRQKERVERAQDDSRNFGRFMFVQSKVMAAIRDRMVAFYSLQRMLADLSKVMEGK